MDLEIEQLSDETYEAAVEIAIATGSKKDVEERLTNHERYYVALLDGDVVGEIGWYTDDGNWSGEALGEIFPSGEGVFWLSHFAVSENHRSRGIGTKLLRFLERVLRDKGGKELWVYTSRARVFYEKVGFTFVKRGYVDECWQDFLMKDL